MARPPTIVRAAAERPRKRCRGIEIAEPAQERAKFDVVLVRHCPAQLRGGGPNRAYRPTSGRQLCLHHRGPLQEGRRRPGHRGGHYPRRKAGPECHPAGGDWWRRESPRPVRIVDRTACQGNRKSCRSTPLGVLQLSVRNRSVVEVYPFVFIGPACCLVQVYRQANVASLRPGTCYKRMLTDSYS